MVDRGLDAHGLRVLRLPAPAGRGDHHRPAHRTQPKLPVINAPGKALEHTPVHVLTESDPQALAAQLAERGLNYHAVGFTPHTLPEVVAGLESNSDEILCESGPNLAYRVLAHYPDTELHLSITPRYLHDERTHFSGLDADIELQMDASSSAVTRSSSAMRRPIRPPNERTRHARSGVTPDRRHAG